MNIKKLFQEHADEYLCSERDASLEGKRLDLVLFNMLDSLVPGEGYIIIATGHEEIFLDTHPEKLLNSATEDQIIKMIRCGLRYSEEHECFCMFV